MRFKPGVSGNPGGRPKGLAAALRAKYGPDAQKLVSELEKIAFAKEGVPPRVRVDAIRELLNRHSGKPPDIVKLEDDDGTGLPAAVTFIIRGRSAA